MEIFNEFKNKTVEILTRTFDSYSRLFDGNIDSNYRSVFIGGRYQVMEKAGFATNQEIAYMNSDTIAAEGVALEFENTSLNVFALMQPNKYILKEEDIFKAIDKLNLDPAEYIIAAIGVNMNYFSMLNIQDLKQENEKWSYKQIEIIDINNQMNGLVRQSFFIMKRMDLPSMVYNDVSGKIIEKFKLQKIDSSKCLYANVLDLNKPENQAVRDEIPNINIADLSKFVLVCVGINTEIRYKIDVSSIQLKIFDQFKDRGTVNTLSDVQAIC